MGQTLIAEQLIEQARTATGLDRFEARAQRRQTLVLASYFAAQWLIAVSVTRDIWWSS